MKELIELVEELYNFKINQYKVLKEIHENYNIIFIVTNTGKFIVKCTNKSEEKLTHALFVTKHAEGNVNIVKVIPNKYGEKYFKNNNEQYCYLYEFLEGNNIKNDDDEAVLKAAKTLAIFHKSSTHLGNELTPKEKHYNSVPQKIEKLKKIFNDLHDRLEKVNNKISNIFIENYPLFYNKLLSIEGTILPLSPTISKQAFLEKQIWQGDCGLRNFIKSLNGEVFIIDVETITYNIAILDLIKFLKSLNWDDKLIINSITSYCSERFLSKNELQFLICLLDLPQEFISYPDKYLRKGEQIYLAKFNDYIEDSLRRQSCIDNIKKHFQLENAF